MILYVSILSINDPFDGVSQKSETSRIDHQVIIHEMTHLMSFLKFTPLNALAPAESPPREVLQAGNLPSPNYTIREAIC